MCIAENNLLYMYLFMGLIVLLSTGLFLRYVCCVPNEDNAAVLIKEQREINMITKKNEEKDDIELSNDLTSEAPINAKNSIN